MNNPLGSYLQDHLAASAFAVELLDNLRDHHSDDPLGILATGLKVEIEEDRATLQQVADRIGSGIHPLKETAGWVSEKASRVKLHHKADDRLGAFETLEALSLGLLGKRALWNALAVAAPQVPRLAEYDFESLGARAQDQYTRVEAQRLALAPAALTAPAT